MPITIENIRNQAFADFRLLGNVYPPPINHEKLAEGEAQLGFSLPPLLRQLYLEVSNGGFGPGIGHPFSGINHLQRLINRYLQQRSSGPSDEDWQDDDVVWPEGLAPICEWGCGRFSSIDCLHAPYPIVYHDAEFREMNGGVSTHPGFPAMKRRLDEHGFFEKYGKLYGSSWVVAKSFETWINAWLSDEDVEKMCRPQPRRLSESARYME